MTKVVSSNIEAVSYRYRIMTVQFKGGSTYTYHKVPRAIYQAFMAAESKGKYLNQHIKGVYQYRRVQ